MKVLISWVAHNNDFENAQVNKTGPNYSYHQHFFNHDKHVILSSAKGDDTRTEKLLAALKKDFNKDNIIIETEEIFQHLKDFLFDESDDYISSKLCSIYAIEIENNIRWYIFFSSSVLKMKPKYFSLWKSNDLENVSFPIPAMLIWKLLIDTNLRWNWYWWKLINFALTTAYELSKTIWIRFVIVDANNNAVWFYEKYWFISIDEKEKTTTMVFDLKEFDEL